MKHRLFTASVIALCVFTVLCTSVHATPPKYTVTVLENLAGGNDGHASGINASGQIVGSDDGGAVVRWTGATPTNLTSLGNFNYGFGINASGQVAGYDQYAGSSIRWTGMAPTQLGNLSGNSSVAFGINDFGQIAGYSYVDQSNTIMHAVRWTGTTPTDLGTLGGSYSQGFGINNIGQIAGFSSIPDGNQHAVRWTGTTPTDLGTLDGRYSAGNGINDSGQIAGVASTAGHEHAVVWTGTVPTDLGTLGGNSSYALAINASGIVVGESLIADDGTFRPFLYTEGAMYDLNSLLVPGSGITALYLEYHGNNINDLGEIAATGSIGGQYYALRLTPVNAPEPSITLFLAVGIAAVFFQRMRKSLSESELRPGGSGHHSGGG